MQKEKIKSMVILWLDYRGSVVHLKILRGIFWVQYKSTALVAQCWLPQKNNFSLSLGKKKERKKERRKLKRKKLRPFHTKNDNVSVTYVTFVPWRRERRRHVDDQRIGNLQPDLTAIRTYFTRWLIHMNLYNLTCTNSYGFCQIVRILRVAQFVWICTNDLHLTPPLNLPVTGV